MPFSTEQVQAGEYVLVRYEGRVGSRELHGAHAVVREELDVHGWGVCRMVPFREDGF